MQTQDIWWETVFEGHLAHGFNKERMGELDQEEFLYFEIEQVEEHLNQMQ
ncbi:hypothetical protein ORD22_01235 [Sporosarcina sp. GW1-11]|nr:hypothetical protein [Sporosarcina sp. GW1-11]MDV6376887.1 hypothetical protein [Sporosarcina sp. GW1-11]